MAGEYHVEKLELPSFPDRFDMGGIDVGLQAVFLQCDRRQEQLHNYPGPLVVQKKLAIDIITSIIWGE